jgi:hypothetical protein
MPVYNLLTKLNELNSSKKEYKTECNYIMEEKDILLTDIDILADKALITKDGHPNFDNNQILKENGFDVFPVERDSFGWLIGGIRTEKGIITYG